MNYSLNFYILKYFYFHLQTNKNGFLIRCLYSTNFSICIIEENQCCSIDAKGIKRIEELFNTLHLILRSHPRVVRVTDRKIALKGVLIYLVVMIVEREEPVSLSLKEYSKEEAEWSEEKRREERRDPARFVHLDRGILCLIRRSQLAEAVRTGIHIRYGPGSQVLPSVCRSRFSGANTTAASTQTITLANTAASSFTTFSAEFRYLILYILFFYYLHQLYIITI